PHRRRGRGRQPRGLAMSTETNLAQAEARPSPWDRRPDETEPAYVRFLIFLSLGPARTLDGAYQIFHERLGEKPARAQASGQWSRDSRRFGWVQRARAWDLEMFTAHGQETALRYYSALNAAALKLLEGVADLGPPESWKEALELMQLLGNLLHPD